MLGSSSLEGQVRVPKKKNSTDAEMPQDDDCYELNSTNLSMGISNRSCLYEETDPNYCMDVKVKSIAVIGYSLLNTPIGNLGHLIFEGDYANFNLVFSASSIENILDNGTNNSINLDIIVIHQQKSTVPGSAWSNDIVETYSLEWRYCRKKGQTSPFSIRTLRIAADKGKTEFIISPNPAKDDLNIEFDLEENTDVSISIYNSIGKEIKSIFNSKALEKRTYSEKVTLDGLSSGIYYLVFRNGDKITTEKIVKM